MALASTTVRLVVVAGQADDGTNLGPDQATVGLQPNLQAQKRGSEETRPTRRVWFPRERSVFIIQLGFPRHKICFEHVSPVLNDLLISNCKARKRQR